MPEPPYPSSIGPTELPPRFGRYRVLKKLGGGGMGSVYLVENTELEREEALKVPHFGDGADTELRERFLREARSAAKLDHPNLCPVYDAGVLDGVYYLTMRYLKGRLLSDYAGKAQPARKAVEIATKLAQALEAAHGKGVIHRDLKPSNVMMVAGVGPVVMDFGLAKQVHKADSKLTQAGSMLGTPAYMPPEQVDGDLERMGPASDVYSLGVILYELLTGRLPFEGTMASILGKILHAEPPLPSAVVPELNPALDAICRKAMAKATTERYPSMKAFAAVLLDYWRSTPASEGAGTLVLAAVDRAAVFQAPTAVPGPQAAGTADVFQAATVVPQGMLGPNTPSPRPDEAIPSGLKVLRIGREPDNDFPVNLSTVSGYHARVVWDGGTGRATIEDLGSSNGTALGSPERRITRAALTATDTVFLGTHPIPGSVLLARVAAGPGPLPPLTFRGREMIVGRDAHCDLVIDLPIVSGRHARLTRSGSLILIEDLGSSNGTYVNAQRIDRQVVVASGDRIRLGNYTLELVVADPAAAVQTVPVTALAGVPMPALSPAPAWTDQGAASSPGGSPIPQTSAATVRRFWPLVAVVVLVPLFAGVYLIVSGSGKRSQGGGEGGRDTTQRPPASSDVRPGAGLADRREKPAERVPAPAPVAPVAPPRPAPDPGPIASASPVKPPLDAERPQGTLKPPSDQPPGAVLAWADSLDLSNLTSADETRLGNELHQLVLTHLTPVEEGPWMERAANAARRVSDADFTITILDSNAVNAFSFPGGRIYICRGLFDIIGTDEDYILEFAIGHEIAHLTAKHALKSVAANAAEARKRGIDTLNQFLVPIALGYRNAREFEADAWVYRRMLAEPDYTKRMCLAFLRKLRDYADHQKFANGRKAPDKDFPLFENHFRAHPAARDRLKRLESFSAEPGSTQAK